MITTMMMFDHEEKEREEEIERNIWMQYYLLISVPER